MAFTFCTNCGNKIEDGVEKCPYCGHIKGSERGYIYGNADYSQPQNQTPNPTQPENEGQPNHGEQAPPKNPYEQNPYGQNPYGQGPYGNQTGNQQTPSQNPYGNPYGNQNPYGNPYADKNRQGQNPYGQQYPYGMPPPGGFYRPVQDRPISVGLLIFSILNIVFGCCCSVGFIFGIIALVYTVNARQAPTDEEEIRRKKIALVMNISAVVMTIAMIVAFYIAMINGIIM